MDTDFSELVGDDLNYLGNFIVQQSLMALDASDIPFDGVQDFDIRSIDLQEIKWDAECPSCGKISKGGTKFLGQRVTCKCGQKFVFPWWNLNRLSVKHLPSIL